MRKQFPTVNDAIQTSDDAASPSTIVVRDGAGDVFGNTLRAAIGFRNGGNWHRMVAAKSANFTVGDADDVLVVDTTAGSVVATLPAAAANAGKVVTVVKKVAANTLTLQGSGAENINGANTLAVTTQYATKTIACDGTQWYVLN